METNTDESNKYNGIAGRHSFKLKIIFESAAVGIITGLIISLLRLLVDKSGNLINNIYNTLTLKYLLIPVWIFILIITGYVTGLIIKKQPMIRGSGIPQVEAVIHENFEENWWKVILGKFSGTVLAIGSGLSMGIEGPSVQIGSAVGHGFSKISKRLKIEEKYLITSGASAGIAAAFNAPLAGTMFALEEIHKSLSPVLLVSAFSAAAAGDFISSSFFGLKPVFDFRNAFILPINHYIFIIVLGIIMGISGTIFNRALLTTQKLFSKQKWLPIEFRPVICALISVFAGFMLPQILGESNSLIMSLEKGSIAVKILLILLLVKFLFSMLCCASGTPGGIFLPLFTVGSLLGAIYGSLLTQILHINSAYIGSFVILAMAAYFSSVIRAPMTAAILVIEMTGSFSNLLPVAIISLVSCVTANLIHSEPIYESLLKQFLNNDEEMKKRAEGCKQAV